MNHSEPATAEQLGLGDHVAYFFKTNQERLDFVVPYIVNGLKNFERCIYIAEENTVPVIFSVLKKAGVDIAETTSSGALSVVTKHDTYLRHGVFEPEKMINDLDLDVCLALESGFSGLRVTGEMSWALDLPFALGQLCEYEMELNSRWPRELGGLFQYNETLFPADMVQNMIGCHPIVVRDGTIFRQHIHAPANAA